MNASAGSRVFVGTIADLWRDPLRLALELTLDQRLVPVTAVNLNRQMFRGLRDNQVQEPTVIKRFASNHVHDIRRDLVLPRVPNSLLSTVDANDADAVRGAGNASVHFEPLRVFVVMLSSSFE